MKALEKLLGIELPIIQAPMAGAQDSELAIAVAQAGALGSLPCALLSPDDIRREIHTIQASTSAPLNVNFFCHTPPRVDPEREAAWRAALLPYYHELGLDPQLVPQPATRAAFDAQAAELIRELAPAVVSFHFGLPSADLLQHVRAAGAKILSTATTIAEGVWLAEQGVDAVIAQGLEAGGHRGMFLTGDLTTQMGTMALVPQLVRAIDLPVIAAGGIADAEGVAAALALGAAGVQVGTAYLLCPEAKISPVHRAALASQQARHTALTNIFTGRPARGIVNRLMKELGPLSGLAPEFPLAGGATGPLRTHAERASSGDFSPLWSGQNASGCQPLPAAQLTRKLAAGLPSRS